MSYNSDRIDPRDVAVYKRMLEQLCIGAMVPNQQLAFAQALEEKAVEIRQKAIEIAKNDIQ